MPQTFQLTGDGATGLIIGPHQLATVANLPVSVCLGRRGITNRGQSLRLEDFVDKIGAVPVPEKMDWYTKAAPSIARIYRNNVKGCCVISGSMHDFGVWSANDPDSANGQVVLATDAEVDQQYAAICGPGDNGCNIQSVLDHMVRVGLTAGGVAYKLRGYCSFDWRSKELTKVAIAIGGALKIGFNLPGAWMNSSVWDTSNANGIVGGHDVAPVGYGAPAAIATTADGVVVASWGRLYLITWAAWVSTRYLDEAYFMVPEFLWTGVDGMAPSGINLEGMLAAMAAIKGGQVPQLPDPNPPPDPTPDPPPVGGVRFGLPGGGQLTAEYATKRITYPAGWNASELG